MRKVGRQDCCILDVKAISLEAYTNAAEGGHFRIENNAENALKVDYWTEAEANGGGYSVVSIGNPESSEDDLPEVRSFMVPNVGIDGSGSIVLTQLSRNQKYMIVVLGEEIELI